MSKTDKIAVFGSAFNPPTLGHLSVLQRLGHFSQVLLVPNYRHAWGKTMADYDKRCQWLALFIEESGLDNLVLCQEEQKLGQQGPVTTWALLNHLQALYPNAELTFVLGPDNLLNFAKFDHAQDILARWSLFAAPQTVAIRSTVIRDKLTKGLAVTGLTTPKLAARLDFDDFT